MKIRSIIDKPSFQGYAFVLPAMLVLLALTGYPVVYNIILGFFKSGYGVHKFVGIENYIKAFTSRGFGEVVVNTLIWTVFNMSVMMLLGFISAIAINRGVTGKTGYQVILLVPWVVPFVVAGIMWRFLFHPRWGAINDLLIRIGLISERFAMLAKPKTALLGVMIAYIWKVYPFVTVLILAGLKAIPDVLYDAAEVDGASGFKRIWYVTIPQLRNILGTIILVVGIWTFNTFDLIYIMTAGGPLYSSETVAMRIYKFGFHDFRFGLSAATSLISSMVLVIACIFYLREEA